VLRQLGNVRPIRRPSSCLSNWPLTYGATQFKWLGPIRSAATLLEPIMNITKPLGSDEIEKSSEGEIRQNVHELMRGEAENDDAKMSADDLAALLHRMSDAATCEIENLINELQALRRQLQNAGNRIQRDIVEYAKLSQQVTQLTAIISGSVRKLPPAAHG
jgi:hypothetical protein